MATGQTLHPQEQETERHIWGLKQETRIRHFAMSYLLTLVLAKSRFKRLISEDLKKTLAENV